MLKYLLLLALVALNAFAIPENEVEQKWKDEAYSYYTSTPLETFKNAQGLQVTFRSFTNPSNQKALVIVPGRSEPAQKYAELIYDLRLKGLDIHVIDHQGQGESQRTLRDHQKGYVAKFENYVSDFDQWMSEKVLPETAGKELYLLAHSMGGAVAAYYLADHADVFKKAVLTAPMMELNTKPYSEKVATLLSSFLVGAGLGRSYAPGRGPYVAEKDLFEKNDVTHSSPRFNITKLISTDWPELTIGGPTSRWVKESLKATKNIDELGPKIKTPLLVFQAQKDQIVKLPRQTSFCSKAPTCRLVPFPEAGHEIFMEKDATRDEAIRELLDFIGAKK